MVVLIKLTNQATGKNVGTIPVATWETIKKDPRWRNVFRAEEIHEPPEVTALKIRLNGKTEKKSSL